MDIRKGTGRVHSRCARAISHGSARSGARVDADGACADAIIHTYGPHNGTARGRRAPLKR